MKNTKKFAAMIAALTLTACSIAPMASFAVDAATTDFTMTSPELPSGTSISNIRAVKIFNAELNNGAFNVKEWATGINETTQAALKEAIGSEDTEVAAIAAKITDDNKIAFAKAAAIALKEEEGITGTLSGNTVKFTSSLGVGYYVVLCDVTPENSHPSNTSYNSTSLGMLTVTGREDDVQIGLGEAKVGLPEVMKKVKEDTHIVTGYDGESLGVLESMVNSDNESTTDGDWNDVADYDIGDAVPFKLYGTLPADYDNYEKYYYCFSDSLGTDFAAPDSTAITVKCGENDITSYFDINIVDNAIIIACENLKTISNDDGTKIIDKDSVITVEYTAVLNSTANVGKPGQQNEVTLTYSNNPNQQGEGDRGETPEDKVIVYTYALKIDKDFFNESGTELTVEEIENKTYDDAVVFNLFEGENDEGTPLTFIEYNGEDGAYDYVVSTDTEAASDLKLNLVDGEFVVRIKGLDDGKYTLKETAGPDGFNLAPNQTITLSANTENDQTWTKIPEDETLNSFKYTVGETETDSTDDATGKLIVENRQGASLPSTGGMGTTLFYLGGGAMVAVAGVFLITKKRMGKSEN